MWLLASFVTSEVSLVHETIAIYAFSFSPSIIPLTILRKTDLTSVSRRRHPSFFLKHFSYTSDPPARAGDARRGRVFRGIVFTFRRPPRHFHAGGMSFDFLRKSSTYLSHFSLPLPKTGFTAETRETPKWLWTNQMAQQRITAKWPHRGTAGRETEDLVSNVPLIRVAPPHYPTTTFTLGHLKSLPADPPLSNRVTSRLT